MPLTSDPTNTRTDPFDLQRFVIAQQAVYGNVLAELRNGEKRSHWMWFIFPQFDGLGNSSMSKRYAIKSEAEARQYLDHPILGARLVECAETILTIKERSALSIFGFPDDKKLRSSMTLFAAITDPESVFARVLDTYFKGRRDGKTLELLEQHNT